MPGMISEKGIKSYRRERREESEVRANPAPTKALRYITWSEDPR
jgi:hypothetical protein